MKADGIGCGGDLPFLGCSADLVRGDLSEQKRIRTTAGSAASMRGSVFLPHRPTGWTYGSVVFAFLSFLFFSLRGFPNRLSRLHIIGNCFIIPIVEYRERNGAWDTFGRDCVFPLLTYVSMCIATIICVSRNGFLHREMINSHDKRSLPQLKKLCYVHQMFMLIIRFVSH